MRLLNKSKDLVKYSIFTLLTIVVLMISIPFWKADYTKGMQKFEKEYTSKVMLLLREQGYTYCKKGTEDYIKKTKEEMAFSMMNPRFTVIIALDLLVALFCIYKIIVSYRKLSRFIGEQAELEEQNLKQLKE